MWGKVLLVLIGTYVAAAAVWVVAAGVQSAPSGAELLNVACDPTRELWRELNTAFLRNRRDRGLSTPVIRMSHGGSASQARSVVDGLDADIASLALYTDTDAIRRAKLLDDGWVDRFPNRSLPYVSTIVMVVRAGNPKGIRDWTDLGRDDVKVITPNPKTSGNGKWSFLALWGSVVWRGGTTDEARSYVAAVFGRVPVLDPAARGATMTFATKGIGDVHLTWENEAHLEVQESGGKLEIVYPHRANEKPLSVLAEPHIAIVDRNVDRKRTRAIAEEYVRFLYAEPAQEIIAKNFHRPTNAAVFARHRDRFPEMDLRHATSLVPTKTWDEVQSLYFAEGGEFDRIYQRK